jgi:D-alanyl-D-alanine carboxypeptidase (penicillin-binding protein 5/6)
MPSSTTTPASATAPPANVALPGSRSYVLVDVDTGNVLAGYNERLLVPPASLSKVLTALIAVSYLPSDARVPGTKASEDAYPNTIGIEKGVAWPLYDVLQSLLVYSANDAAYAIAQRISGSLAAFGPVMERSALQIGMTGPAVLHDPAGLDGTEGVDGGNLMSARDLAIAGRDLLHVPELAKIVAEETYDFVDPTGKPVDLPSMNFDFLANYPGAIGVKTGFTDRAGDCIMAAATRDGRTMLAVVMNGYNIQASATDLLNEGFATPVNAELTSDRLPPVSLPTPAPPGGLPRRPSAGGQTNNGRPAEGAFARSSGQRSSASAPDRTSSASAPGRNGRPRSASTGPVRSASRSRSGGLAAVLRAWPGKALLILSGAAALFALWEIVSTNRLRHYRDRPGPSGASTGLMSTFSATRRRREQLVDSYRRHQRVDASPGASPHFRG